MRSERNEEDFFFIQEDMSHLQKSQSGNCFNFEAKVNSISIANVEQRIENGCVRQRKGCFTCPRQLQCSIQLEKVDQLVEQREERRGLREQTINHSSYSLYLLVCLPTKNKEKEDQRRYQAWCPVFVTVVSTKST